MEFLAPSLIKVSFLICHIWISVFKNGPRKIFGRQPLKKLPIYGRFMIINFSKAVFHNFFSVHSWIHWLICANKALCTHIHNPSIANMIRAHCGTEICLTFKNSNLANLCNISGKKKIYKLEPILGHGCGLFPYLPQN